MQTFSKKTSSRKRTYHWIVPIVVAIFFLAIGYLLGTLTQDNLMPWYRSLLKPALTPPDWIFSVVWSILYVLLAFIGYELWLKRSEQRHHSLFYLFVVQMILNWLWTPVFFGFHLIGLGLLILFVLVLLNLVITFRCWLINRKLGLMLTPYLFWLVFALYLNFMIWNLNEFL